MPDSQHLCGDSRFCDVCTPGCDSAFSRVFVDRTVAQGSRVEWSLVPEFSDPRPFTFQLQAAETQDPTAADWTNAGLSVVDCFYALDSEQRDFGEESYSCYRVVLTTSLGTYYSDPTGAAGVLDGRDWLMARETLRQRKQAWRIGKAGVPGYLYQRRVSGAPCPHCLDAALGESTQAECPNCFGTGFACGYYFPIACVWAELGLQTGEVKLDPAGERGSIDDQSIQCEMAGVPAPHSLDVWASSVTDDRYTIRAITQKAAIRGVSVVVGVVMRKLPYSSPLYGLPVPRDEENDCGCS